MTLSGIDVSNNNGWVDWTKKKGVNFCVAKVSQGVGFRDGNAAANLAGATNLGMRRGAYHFVDFSGADAEAAFFDGAFRSAGGVRVGDVAAMDMEQVPPAGVNPGLYALEFLSEVHALTGVKPWVYTYLAYAQEYFTDHPELGEYPLWVADLSVVPPAPPKPWTVLTAWQYSWTGTVPGIGYPVDMDEFFGDATTWAKLSKGGAQRTVLQPSGLKRSAYHGGPDLMKLPANAVVQDMGVESSGFTEVLAPSGKTTVTGWVDTTHLSRA